MAKLVIFGASGRTGKPLVEQALAAGHEVIAFVRDASKLPLQHEKLTLCVGDVMNAGDVERAIASDVDAVLSAIGHAKGSPKDMQTVGTRNMIAAMEQRGVRRIVSLTGAGVADPNDRPKLIDHIIKFMLRTLSGDVLEDAVNHAEVLRASDRDWIIVRGPMLTEGPHTGSYRVGWVGVNTSPRISRADVADFMLTQVDDDTYLRQMPMVSD